jgi:hypothetical protein
MNYHELSLGIQRMISEWLRQYGFAETPRSIEKPLNDLIDALAEVRDSYEKRTNGETNP